jgi:hypothetical protein
MLRINSAKNLDARKINMLRDSSSPAAPQNDIFGYLFISQLALQVVCKLAGPDFISACQVFATNMECWENGSIGKAVSCPFLPTVDLGKT